MANVNTTLIARAVCVALAMAGGVAARAQDAGEANLDVTIRLLPENAVGPEDITRRIELPPAAARPTPPRAESDDEAAPPWRPRSRRWSSAVGCGIAVRRQSPCRKFGRR